MPHVVLSGEVNAELIFEKLDNIFEKTSGGILRTTNHFLDINKKVILVESLAIENNNKTSFLVMINNREVESWFEFIQCMMISRKLKELRKSLQRLLSK